MFEFSYKNITSIIHNEGYIFIIIGLVITLLVASISSGLGILGFIVTLWCAFFFRDPDRYVLNSDSVVLSGADGVVQSISTVVPPKDLNLSDAEMTRVSVFLNIFNVHVNRVPLSGKITHMHYHPGKFLNASLDKASIHNERQSFVVESHDGVKIGCVQIAGLIARRIVCKVDEGQNVKVGDRYGIIRFGSRYDIYLPKHIKILVSEGQIAIGGETIIAKLQDTEPNTLSFIRK